LAIQNVFVLPLVDNVASERARFVRFAGVLLNQEYEQIIMVNTLSTFFNL